jgi:anaerobic ribonucleoside-triphosphate reductase activating protein
MKLRLSRLHFPVTSLGYGRRIGIWMQGCTLACSGCISRDTWDPEGGVEAELGELLSWAGALDGPIDGATVSGGEPFQQPEALAALLAGLRALGARRNGDFDLLLFSGLRRATLERRFGAVLALADAVVAGPFVAAQAPGGPLSGSANQEVLATSALGRRRYCEGRLAEAQAARPFQIEVDSRGVWGIGIPRPGDLDRLVAAARGRGVVLGEHSWRA